MAKSLAEWKSIVFNGKPIDLDNQSYDCVDVSKHWVEYLTNVGWQTSAGWGNAKDIYDYWSAKYLEKLPAGTFPQLGDIAVMNGTIGGGYGHTGVVIAISGNSMQIAQQDTFKQVATYTGWWNATGSYVRFMRPKVAFTIDTAVALQPHQRIASYAAKYRKSADDDAELLQTFTAGDTYDFKGYVHGENVDGNDVWFVGAYTGGYAWSGAFTDASVNGLADLTPASLQPNQRQVGADIMNVRREPILTPDNVQTTIAAGTIHTFDGWKTGADVEGNSVWFKLAGSGYVWSGGFTNTGVSGLPQLEVAGTPAPVPTTPDYSFTKDLACVTEVDPAPNGNFEYGNFPAKPQKVVLHDFGTKGRDTFGSTRNEFNRLKAEKSAHFVVSGKMILQMVKLGDRAYHAGKNGNDFVGVEIDPNMDEDTKASVRTLRKELDEFYGYKLVPVEHNQIMATDCGDDVVIEDLDPYKVVEPTPTDPEDPVIVQPTPEPNTPDVITRIKTVAVNAVVTFVQAFLATWAATGFNLDKVVLAGAIGGALSLVWNTILKPFAISQGWLKQ